MKNKFFYITLVFLLSNILNRGTFNTIKNITLDKKIGISIFENEVSVRTSENNTIKSDYAEYDKKRFSQTKKNIRASDDKN